MTVGVPGKRERNAHARRTSLLEAGERLGRQKGWSALSVEDITDAAGMAKGNFYHYFSSKEALRAALEARHFDDVAGQIPAIALSSDPIGGTAGYMAHLVDLASSSGPDGVRRLLALVSQTDGEEGADTFFHYTRLLQMFEQERTLRKKTPLEDLTATLDALTLGILTVWVADPHRDEPGRRAVDRVETAADLVLRRVLRPWVREKALKDRMFKDGPLKNTASEDGPAENPEDGK